MDKFASLKTEIVSGARQAFLACREAHPGERFIGYALYSDDGAMTLGHSAAIERELDGWSYGAPDDYRFNPSEWSISSGAESLRNANAMINDPTLRNQLGEGFFEFRQQLFEAVVLALEELIDEGFFRTEADAPRLFVTFSIVDTQHQDWIAGWVKRLNSKDVARRYAAWEKTWRVGG